MKKVVPTTAKSLAEKGMKVTTLPPSRILPEWLHFVDKVSGPFIVRETRGIQISQTQKIFGIVLSAFDVDMTAGPDTVETYFIKTIGFLKKNYPESPVFVKPHPVLDRVSIKNLIDDSGHKLCFLTEMHSAVLGKICDIVICNFFSFSITDAWVQGCRTIEYTEYAAAVTQILSEKSWRGEFIDMFVNGNDELFEQSVKRLLSEGRKKKKLFSLEG